MNQTVQQRVVARLLRQRREARRSPNVFIEYAFRDEVDRPLVQSPFHEEWQNILSAQDRVVIMASVEHGKSVQMSVSRPIWEIGRNPGVRILLVTAAATQGYKFLGSVKSNIENNVRIREVFPDLSRDRFSTWAQSHILYRMDKASTRHDYTMQAVGVGGAILGARIDIAILDDVLDFQNTATREQRKKVVDWFETTLLNRIVDGGKVWCLGTAWHPQDLLHHLMKLSDFSGHRYPAHVNGIPIWPKVWSKERLEQRRRQLTPYRFAQQFECRAIDDETRRFDVDWFERCKELGRGLSWPARKYPGDVIVGVDLGIKQKRTSHETAFFVLGGDPETGKKRPLYAVSGRWRKKEIIKRAMAIFRRYGGVFVVEDVQAQNYLIQDLEEDTPIPVVPYLTRKGRKLHPEFGIESIGVELMNRKWLLPCDSNGRVPEVLQTWEDQCMEFSPSEHAGDLLMASFFALEGIRREARGEGGIEVG